MKNTNKSGYLWHFKSSFHNLQHCRKLSRPGFNPNGALWRCWCVVFSADHLFLMAKQRQNEKAPVCGGTNHAENLLSAPSRHLFSTTVSVSDSLWRFSSKPFQPPYFPTVNCFTSPEPNYGFHTFSLSCRLFSFHTGSTLKVELQQTDGSEIFSLKYQEAHDQLLAELSKRGKLNCIEFYTSEDFWKFSVRMLEVALFCRWDKEQQCCEHVFVECTVW